MKVQTSPQNKENQISFSNIINSRIDNLLKKSKKYQRVPFKNGIYFGQLNPQSNQFSGVGSAFFDSGSFYYGEWRDDNLNGVGVYVFNVGGFIRGHFKDGKVDGLAEINFKDSSCYQGFWKEGNYHGFGKKKKAGYNDQYTVCYQDGKRFKNQNSQSLKKYDFQLQRLNNFDQEYFDNLIKQHLPCIYSHTDRVVYGLQCDLTGLGCIIFRNGRIDIGNFKNGCLEGRGKVIFASGDIYDGTLVDGQFQGSGQYLNYQNKIVTEGIFAQNQILVIKNEIKKYPPTTQPFNFEMEQSSFLQESNMFIERPKIDVQVVSNRIDQKNIEKKQLHAQKQIYSSCKNLISQKLRITSPTPNKKIQSIQNIIKQLLYEDDQQSDLEVRRKSENKLMSNKSTKAKFFNK